MSPNGVWLADAESIRETLSSLRLWNVPSQTLVSVPDVVANVAPAFSPDSRWMAYANTGGTVTVWPLPGNSAQPLDIPVQASALAYSPDGTMLAAGAPDFSVQLWDTATGASVRGTVPDPNNRDRGPIGIHCLLPRPKIPGHELRSLRPRRSYKQQDQGLAGG